MKTLTHFRWFLWYFGFRKVPLIGYLKPQLIELSDSIAVVKIPLTRRSKNHLSSMYFGALSVGADIAGGLHGFYYARKLNKKMSLAFKSFNAQFLSRPESDVFFVSEMGEAVQNMLEEASKSKQRVNRLIHVDAYSHWGESSLQKKVAVFELELSLKVKNN